MYTCFIFFKFKISQYIYFYFLTCRQNAAVLSITSKHNFIAAGLYTAKITASDPRIFNHNLFELHCHTRSVIDLCLVQDNFLVSLSEDKTLSICDLRTQKTLKTIRLTEVRKHFPTNLFLIFYLYCTFIFLVTAW